MFNKIIPSFVVLATSLLTGSVHAIEISSMFVVADEKGEGLFTITNTQDHRLFMDVGMAEMTVVGGDIRKEKYTRDNFAEWKIDVRPSKTVLNVGHIKDFKVSMKCGNECSKEHDQIFQLAFVPTPYHDPSVHPSKSVQMAIGFGALFLHPAEDKPIQYRAHYGDDGVTIENLGDSYLNVRLTHCPEGTSGAAKNECSRHTKVFAGRKMTIALAEAMQASPYMDIFMETNTKQYTDSARLVKGE